MRTKTTYGFEVTETIVSRSLVTLDRESEWRVPGHGSAWWVIPADRYGKWIGKPSLRRAETATEALESAIRDQDGYGFDEIPVKAFVSPAIDSGVYFGIEVKR